MWIALFPNIVDPEHYYIPFFFTTLSRSRGLHTHPAHTLLVAHPTPRTQQTHCTQQRVWLSVPNPSATPLCHSRFPGAVWPLVPGLFLPPVRPNLLTPKASLKGRGLPGGRVTDFVGVTDLDCGSPTLTFSECGRAFPTTILSDRSFHPPKCSGVCPTEVESGGTLIHQQCHVTPTQQLAVSQHPIFCGPTPRLIWKCKIQSTPPPSRIFLL